MRGRAGRVLRVDAADPQLAPDFRRAAAELEFLALRRCGNQFRSDTGLLTKRCRACPSCQSHEKSMAKVGWIAYQYEREQIGGPLDGMPEEADCGA